MILAHLPIWWCAQAAGWCSPPRQLNSCLCCLHSLRCAALQVGVQQALAEAALQLHQWVLHLQARQLLSITDGSQAGARVAVGPPATCRALVPRSEPVQRDSTTAQLCSGAVRCCSAQNTSTVDGHQGSHEPGCRAPGLGVGPLHGRLHPGRMHDVMLLEVAGGAAHATCNCSSKVLPGACRLSSANGTNGELCAKNCIGMQHHARGLRAAASISLSEGMKQMGAAYNSRHVSVSMSGKRETQASKAAHPCRLALKSAAAVLAACAGACATKPAARTCCACLTAPGGSLSACSWLL